ncbi:sulfatase-like hydrolase/transferase, partial [Mariniphaga sediminis]|uniref:sulfatase-like hydrolase/transferase n=1 Tax=Mariniphaga sediminis TaxID=1628158 RepID=UPI00356A0469
MKILFFTVISLCVISLAGCNQKQVEQPRGPNILFAISDDQTFVHTSFAGSEFVNTPAFDRIAREGIYFTNCIAGSPGCAPS